MDEEKWQRDWQVPPFPLGHPPTLRRRRQQRQRRRPGAVEVLPIGIHRSIGSSWQRAGRSSMQETDLPATNAFKGTSTTNMRVCVCVGVYVSTSMSVFMELKKGRMARSH